MRLTWLADVLRNADLRVVEVPGWKDRGREIGEIKGVILHHTAGPKSGNYPSLATVRDGRPGLNGPLAQLGLGRDGFWWVIAAGKANHAGKGSWRGITNGNDHFIGVEAENTGYTKGPRAEDWSEKQIDAYRRGVAAILGHLNLPADHAIGHKEWAPRRKIDPTFDMNDFRERVAAIMKAKKAKSLKKEEEVFIPEAEIIALEEPWKKTEYPTPEVFIGKAEGPPGTEYRPPMIYKEEPKKADANALRGSDRVKYVFDELKERGWKDFQAAALTAQAVIESDVDSNLEDWTVNKKPAKKSDVGAVLSRAGILCWDSARLAQLDWYKKYLGVEENIWKEKNDLELQVRFIDWELLNNERVAGDQLRNSTNMMDALRAAVAYVRPIGWSNDTPENSSKWIDRVVTAYRIDKK